MSHLRMGWVMVMFDLPVIEPDEKRAATKFRKKLLDQGFFMMQYSVYARPCTSQDMVEKYAQRVKNSLPNEGFVKLLFITDVQWKRGMNLVATPKRGKTASDQNQLNLSFKKDRRAINKDLQIWPQIIFW